MLCKDARCPPQRGMTLLEAMITLVIIAVLLAVATPGMVNMMRDLRRDTVLSDLVADFSQSRSGAVQRGQRVVICPSIVGSCAGVGAWHQGWIAFVDSNGDGELDAMDTLLRRRGPADNDLTALGSRPRIMYQATGFAIGYTDTIRFCDDRGSAAARAVVISNNGRVRVVNAGVVCP